MSTSPAGIDEDPKGITPMQRRVLAGGSAGQFIEFYDLALYGITAVVLSRVFFPGDNEVLKLLGLFATYGIAFFVRPLGGLFFGAIGDRIGRRSVLVATLLTIGIATAAIGVLPGYKTIGVWATVLLVFFRLLQGFSAGGESVGAASFVFEHAPVGRRGLFVNIALAATALPSVFASVLTLSLSAAMSDESFHAWGWRIPFLAALPLALIGLYIRAKTEESPVFQELVAEREPETKTTPIRNAFKFNWLQMIQVVFVMGLTAMGFYFLSGYFVPYVETAGNLSRNQALGMNAFAMAAYTILLPLMGHIGDRVGRRPMLIGGAITVAVLAIPAFMLVTTGNVFLAVLGQVIFVIAITLYGGGCYTFFVEVFSTENRFTAAALSYNVGYALLGGTAPFVGEWFVNQTGVAYSPAFWVIGIALVTLLVMWITRVPETRGWKA
jgi:MHS family proline/betaine transporter-like MFS transporter